MVKTRLFMLLLTMLIVSGFGAVAILYSKGFRLERSENKVSIEPKGLLVVNSEPTGAQVFLDRELKTATNNSISASPGKHFLEVKRAGYLGFGKEVEIKQEEVTAVNAYLIPQAPSLTALSFSGVQNPSVSPDQTKIAYFVPREKGDNEKYGIWVYETVNLPIGFGREPKRVTNLDLSEFSWEWSPDSKEVLIASKSASYKLSINGFVDSKDLKNITNEESKIRGDWENSKQEKINAILKNIDQNISNVFKKHTKDVTFSADETKILYTATASAFIPTGLVKELPGSSTQKETRNIVAGNQYVYDIKEDKNFFIHGDSQKIYWITNSLNLVIPEKDRISIVDYDGTNKQAVFTGNYIFPYAFPVTSTSKMVILTNFGSTGSLPNLYWLSLK